MHAAAKYFDFTGLVVPSGHYKASYCDQLEANFGPTLVGAGINGVWNLTVGDYQASSTGTLTRWGLIINGGAVQPCCPADFDGDGVASIGDIFAMLSAWFAMDPRTDFNTAVPGQDIGDIFAYLAIWFQGC
jgi:hypothetical protein